MGWLDCTVADNSLFKSSQVRRGENTVGIQAANS